MVVGAFKVSIQFIVGNIIIEMKTPGVNSTDLDISVVQLNIKPCSCAHLSKKTWWNAQSYYFDAHPRVFLSSL